MFRVHTESPRAQREVHISISTGLASRSRSTRCTQRAFGVGTECTRRLGCCSVQHTNSRETPQCWSLRKEDERRLLVAEMSWLRRIIGRSRREKVRSEQP